MIFLLLLLLAPFSTIFGEVSVIQTPYAIAYTPHSILSENPADSEIRYAGDRPRYSTCTGIGWFFKDKYLAALNLMTSSLQVYQFNDRGHELIPLQSFNKKHELELERPENLAFSNDCQLLAIANMKNGQVNIYKIATTTLINTPLFPPNYVIKDDSVHGVRFSSDGKYLAYVSTLNPGHICVYRINKDQNGFLILEHCQKMNNPFHPLKPKSLDFSHDNRFVVIGYSVKIQAHEGKGYAVLASYHFDAVSGKIDPTPISQLNLTSTESVVFYPMSSHVFATDQVKDRVTIHPFDITTGKLSQGGTALENPKAQLNFPHGLSISKKGRFIAVTNYGDDKVTIYKINKS